MNSIYDGIPSEDIRDLVQILNTVYTKTTISAMPSANYTDRFEVFADGNDEGVYGICRGWMAARRKYEVYIKQQRG